MVITMGNLITLESNVKHSFFLAKAEIKALREQHRRDNELVQKLFETQKQLLLKVKELENKVKAPPKMDPLPRFEQQVVSSPPQIVHVIEKRMPAEKVVETVVVKDKPKKVVEKVFVKVGNKRSYIGSDTSMKFHDSICPFAKNIKPKNKINFKSKTKALNLGYKACNCIKRV
ncbi:MAG: hypothetical protein HGA85_06605 [Nanoarchaeota archaeon]|nr:hypothetical protein [Nanoarchaeota archaeon]